MSSPADRLRQLAANPRVCPDCGDTAHPAGCMAKSPTPYQETLALLADCLDALDAYYAYAPHMSYCSGFKTCDCGRDELDAKHDAGRAHRGTRIDVVATGSIAAPARGSRLLPLRSLGEADLLCEQLGSSVAASFAPLSPASQPSQRHEGASAPPLVDDGHTASSVRRKLAAGHPPRRCAEGGADDHVARVEVGEDRDGVVAGLHVALLGRGLHVTNIDRREASCQGM